MKLYKISIVVLGAVMGLASCNDIDEQNPAGGVYTIEQVQETTTAVPERSEATFLGLFSMMGQPKATYGSTRSRADDFGYISAAFSQDIEGADVIVQDNNYNWFSAPADFSSRTATYANPYMRYKLPYNQIGVCNELISANETSKNEYWAQAKAMRAFAYMNLAPYFAFSYKGHEKDLDIPVLADGVDYSNNPRATVEEVYAYILQDLNDAISVLSKDTVVRTKKEQIDAQVAYGLRARVELAMEDWQAAADDADRALGLTDQTKATVTYTVATRDEVSKPSFYNIADHNWIWGIDITDAQQQTYPYATSASWIGSFSSYSYAAGVQCYACCNVLLWNKIPSSDIRKQWWVDENLQSSLLNGLSWEGYEGQNVATLAYDDKMEFLPYTNVKFGMMNGIGSSNNANDWPLMRAEEMYLIKAEALAHISGKAEDAIAALKEVAGNRDNSYTVTASGKDGRTLLDEIWFQRRVELWGEGFFESDAKRLNKNIVRFHEGQDSNVPDAFKFNIKYDDPWLNMRFSTAETNNNKGIVDNTGGSLPVSGQNGALRDGVTD